MLMGYLRVRWGMGSVDWLLEWLDGACDLLIGYLSDAMGMG
jgi:hypothetical protein